MTFTAILLQFRFCQRMLCCAFVNRCLSLICVTMLAHLVFSKSKDSLLNIDLFYPGKTRSAALSEIGEPYTY